MIAHRLPSLLVAALIAAPVWLAPTSIAQDAAADDGAAFDPTADPEVWPGDPIPAIGNLGLRNIDRPERPANICTVVPGNRTRALSD